MTLRALAPRGLSCSGGVIPMDATLPYAAEAAAVAGARDKRRREFAAGRFYARQAMWALGVAPQPLPVLPSRAPAWPEGVVGSVAHTDTWCAAAVGRGDAFLGVGLDAEVAAPLSPDVAALVCSAAELRGLPAGPGVPSELPTWVFAAKEAFYKLYHPHVGQFLEFGDVQVQLDLGQQSFLAELRPDLPPFEGRHALPGRIATAGGLILALITWPAA
ncbi:MAG: 4'-phosphopantetheinyl transferase superfamily protein [Stigonema ocellatum SAG 48.90 = DSM 106950]|nr:4'-phosphopantetheinyl transferase superfamily protein [Stigonema ocellatum SAG 48.90 = DSM 106950]